MKLLNLKRLGLLLIAPLMLLSFTGCDDTGDELEDAADSAMDTAGDAAEEVEDAAQNAADEVDDEL
jgi:hypothetical protein